MSVEFHASHPPPLLPGRLCVREEQKKKKKHAPGYKVKHTSTPTVLFHKLHLAFVELLSFSFLIAVRLSTLSLACFHSFVSLSAISFSSFSSFSLPALFWLSIAFFSPPQS